MNYICYDNNNIYCCIFNFYFNFIESKLMVPLTFPIKCTIIGYVITFPNKCTINGFIITFLINVQLIVHYYFSIEYVLKHLLLFLNLSLANIKIELYYILIYIILCQIRIYQ